MLCKSWKKYQNATLTSEKLNFFKNSKLISCTLPSCKEGKVKSNQVFYRPLSINNSCPEYMAEQNWNVKCPEEQVSVLKD